VAPLAVGCGGGGGGGGPTGPIVLTTASDPAPIALTPIQLGTTGLAGSTATVTFTGSSGYSNTQTSIRIDSAGTVTVAVPMYVDPTSGQLASGAVDVVVSQGGRISNSLSLTIQNLPAVADYGVQPGELSHSLFVLRAMLAARRLNELQALHRIPGSSVDTSEAESTLSEELVAAIEARSDIDRVRLDPSLVIDNGTLADGSALQFTSASLDMMDRVAGVFITRTLAGLTSSAFAVTTSASTTQVLKEINQTRSMIDLLLNTAKLGGAQAEPLGWQKLADGIKALTGGASAAVDFLKDATHSPATQEKLGAWGALIGALGTAGDCYGALAAYGYGVATGDQALQDAAVEGMNELNAHGELYVAALQLGSVFLGDVKGKEVVSTVLGVVKLAQDLHETLADKRVEETTRRVAAERPTEFSVVTGNATFTTDLGFSAPPPSVQLEFPDGNVQASGDPQGDYEIVVPLGVPGVDYRAVWLDMFDPVSDMTLSSVQLNLQSLTPGSPSSAPALLGECIDDDAANPDSDDPDCD
jgi:hypothetical protein